MLSPEGQLETGKHKITKQCDTCNREGHTRCRVLRSRKSVPSAEERKVPWRKQSLNRILKGRWQFGKWSGGARADWAEELSVFVCSYGDEQGMDMFGE